MKNNAASPNAKHANKYILCRPACHLRTISLHQVFSLDPNTQIGECILVESPEAKALAAMGESGRRAAEVMYSHLVLSFTAFVG